MVIDKARTRMEQVVAGMSEGVILVDPDQTITYANAAALAMHGVDDLAALGETVAEYRHNFVLHYRDHAETGPLQHPVERVLLGEAIHDAVVEVRQFRDPDRVWMHRIRSLVTTDDAGEPNGLALIMQDVSARYEADARFESMFKANPAPAIVCRVSDLRYVRVNQGFLDLTGYSSEEVLGRSFCEIDLLHRAEHRALAVERLHAGQPIPQMEACLCVRADPEKYVIVAGHPIEMTGGELCVLFTFADLEDRRKAERDLRLSEERFAKAFQLSPIPTALLSADHLIPSSLNEAFATMFGGAEGYETRTAGGQAVPRGPWTDDAERRRFKRELSRTGQIRGFEAKLTTVTGEAVDCLISAEQVLINAETFVLCAVLDITSRKRSEAELIVAIETVMADASWFSRSVIEKLAVLRNPPRPGVASTKLAELTTRESDMMVRICRGATDQAISAELGLSLNTVRNHVTSLYRKLGVNSRSAVVVWARERGIGDSPSFEGPSRNTTR